MMNSYELIGSKTSPLCHMFDSDRLLASDSNEDSNDDHSSNTVDKYHTLDHLDSYDTVMDLENNLMNCHNNGLMNDGHNHHNSHHPNHHLGHNSIDLNGHLINNNANNNCLNSNNNNNKRKQIETNGMANGGQQQQSGVPNGVSVSGANKRVPPPNGKKTKGRVKIKMEFIDNKLRRYTTFSKRKTGIMKKAYELSTLTGTQVMLLVASETGHVYTFATRKLQPMITSDAGKALIQTCLNSPDSGLHCGDQRMSATGFEETDLSYAVGDESPNDKSEDESCEGAGQSSGESSDNGAEDSSEFMTAGITPGTATYAQLENALPLNYLNEINAKLTNRQLISQLNNTNVLLNPTSLSHTSQSTVPSITSLVTTTPSAALQLTSSNTSKLGTIGSNTKPNQTIHNAIHMTHASAQQLLSAGNILLCANGSQIALPTGQSSQSSTSSSTTPTLMYNPTQGLVYATAGTATTAGNTGLITEGLILNLGQNHTTGNTEVLINNNAFSQIQLQQQQQHHQQQQQQLKSMISTGSNSGQTSGAKRGGDGYKKQRTKQ
ncbi:serum response factor-like [Oppia nitens]|uniref:serum response factor-like n=1 Tax=Oppia nitens TaxID=1686743 RepID=UPI0023DC135B|nr:serum response factor-like [Oppia nitens]